MTNPTPRPALRKAEDADLHPAAPRPARSPRAGRAAPSATEPVAPVPAPEPAPAPAKVPKGGKPGKPKGKRKFGGATSDHLRVDAEPPAPEPAASKPASKPRRPVADDLMSGKQVDLDVKVPKALRKRAKDRAKSEGLDLTTVVIDLLHGWATRPPR